MAAPRMLATDLDGTFIGDEAAMLRLWAELEEHGILVVFSTGRHLPSIREFYAGTGSDRRAAACVCMVGTEVWHLDADGYRCDARWERTVSAGWDRAAVDEIVAAIPGARPQDRQWQSPLKSSWFLDDGADAVDELRRRLDVAGLPAKVVYSVDRFLDVVPARSGKGEAVRFVAGSLGVDAAEVVVAGDSGNDLDMMRPRLGFRSIAVANAAPELRRHRAANLYHASAPFAAGIREGLVRFGWLPG